MGQYKQTDRTETDSQTQRGDWWLPEGEGLVDWVTKVKGLRSTDG